ncbi:hypothetical protein [Nocardia fluminea]|uniref:hypothetical protein n=1 Tax=Nocardia fluminea TaxID=134984 RepID=UPI00340D994F
MAVLVAVPVVTHNLSEARHGRLSGLGGEQTQDRPHRREPWRSRGEHRDGLRIRAKLCVVDR